MLKQNSLNQGLNFLQKVRNIDYLEYLYWLKRVYSKPDEGEDWIYEKLEAWIYGIGEAWIYGKQDVWMYGK